MFPWCNFFSTDDEIRHQCVSDSHNSKNIAGKITKKTVLWNTSIFCDAARLIMEQLQQTFSEFANLCNQWRTQRTKTIGNAYTRKRWMSTTKPSIKQRVQTSPRAGSELSRGFQNKCYKTRANKKLKKNGSRRNTFSDRNKHQSTKTLKRCNREVVLHAVENLKTNTETLAIILRPIWVIQNSVKKWKLDFSIEGSSLLTTRSVKMPIEFSFTRLRI